MEKVNTKFYDNGTIAFQHNKILHFMPERSIANAEDLQFVLPNIPLLVRTLELCVMNVKDGDSSTVVESHTPKEIGKIFQVLSNV